MGKMKKTKDETRKLRDYQFEDSQLMEDRIKEEIGENGFGKKEI